MWIRCLAPAALSLLLPLAVLAAEQDRVSPEEAAERVKAGTAVLVDVREPAEWKESGVAANAHLLPLSDLRGERKAWKKFLEQHRDSELIFYCRSGNRANQAAVLLAEEGYTTSNVGSLDDWIAAELPLRDSSKPPVD